MAGSIEGGKQAAKKNLARDPNYYRKIGAMGGKKKWDKPRPFAADKDLARRAGQISKRGAKLFEEYEALESEHGE